jgi:hypothetical protein
VAWNLVDEDTKVATKYWDSVEGVKDLDIPVTDSIFGEYGGGWALVEPYQVTYQSTRSGSTEPDAGVQFLGTINKTDEEFISLVTYIATSNGHDSNGIVDASSALNYLNSPPTSPPPPTSQYYTNYVLDEGPGEPDNPDGEPDNTDGE